MHSATVYSYLSLMAGAAMALPTKNIVKSRQDAGPQNVVYWGQNGGGTVENNDLTTYCTAESGIDIVVLSFLYQWGNGNDIPSGTIGQSCTISSTGEGQNCDDLITAIGTCQTNGVKVILSLGGASAAYSLQSNDEAAKIGTYLWSAYGPAGSNGTSTAATRPLGDVVVDGFDFDIEVNTGSEFYPAMISSLRDSFASDTSKSYYITGAPQCPIPEPNMGDIIGNSTFDYLWPQFYNNNNYTYPCALPVNGNAAFNYDDWVTWTAGTPSKDAKIFIGVPASPLAANGLESGSTYYATPEQLVDIVADKKTNDRFGGVMSWSAGFSDANVINGCTFAQEVRSILDNGAVC